MNWTPFVHGTTAAGTTASLIGAGFAADHFIGGGLGMLASVATGAAVVGGIASQTGADMSSSLISGALTGVLASKMATLDGVSTGSKVAAIATSTALIGLAAAQKARSRPSPF